MSDRRRIGDDVPSGDLANGGWVFYQTRHGVVGDYVVDSDGAGGGPWRIYSVNIAIVADPMSEWYGPRLGAVASSTSTDRATLIRQLKSKDPKERAIAYGDIVGYFGGNEFDSSPLIIEEISDLRRYPKLVLS